MKVLVADDNAMTRMIHHHHLSEWGLEVVEAGDGDRAWELLQEDDPPRIAVLDWMMPGLSGPEVCARLLDRSHGPLVYTILLTARTDEDDMVAALDAGAHSFLTKPVCLPALRALVEVGRRLIAAEDRLATYAGEMERLAEQRAKQLVSAEKEARTDSLTHLPNRRGFSERAAAEIRRASRYDRPLAMLGLDIDHFKRVNDTWGHAAGDEVLRSLAAACKWNLREVDVIGRIGGEEFAILLPEAAEEEALEVAERLRSSVEGLEIPVGEDVLRVTVSIGLAAMQRGDTTPESLLERADERLYAAKRQGRNRVVGPARLTGLTALARAGAGSDSSVVGDPSSTGECWLAV